MILIDKLAYSSVIRHRNTGIKCAFALGTLLICVGVRTLPIAAGILVIMGILTLRWSTVGGKGYGKMMAAPLVFLLLGTIVVAFDFSLEGITYTSHSLLYALRLILVSLAAVSCLYFLTLTTPTLDTLGLLKKCHCPWIVIELMVLIYRFIFILLDLALAITTAQNSRLGNKNMRTGVKSMGQMLARVLGSCHAQIFHIVRFHGSAVLRRQDTGSLPQQPGESRRSGRCGNRSDVTAGSGNLLKNVRRRNMGSIENQSPALKYTIFTIPTAMARKHFGAST